MRIIITFYLTFILIFTLLPIQALASSGDSGTDGFFSWKELADGTVEVTGYTGGVAVNIPDMLSGRAVTAIGEYAFFLDGITSVILPDSVTSIKNSAFSRCLNLSSVTFGSGLVSIGVEAFAFTGLTAVVFPDSLKTIEETAFYRCSSLVAADLGNSLQSIGTSAFSECPLGSVTLPDSLQSIGPYAFSNCMNLTSVLFGSGLFTIGDRAFSSCPLISAVLPDSLQSIGSGAFSECHNLNSIIFGNQLVSIGSDAFSESGLTSVALPNSLITLGDNAFSGCTSLVSVTFGNRLESIGMGAFSSTPIQTASFPDSLITIGDSAFLQCADLVSLTFGNGLETIGQWSFAYCNKITSITLPESLQSITGFSFLECTSLDKVVVLSKTANINPGAFLACPLAGGIYGLAGSTAESTFAGWAQFHYLYTVSFDSASGSAIDDVIVEESSLVPSPAQPVREHYTFGGWFADSALTQAWDFDTDTVNSDRTLSAKWTANPCTVTFDSQGGSGITSQVTPYNTTIGNPADPVRIDFSFGGWYKEAACNNKWDFGADKVTADITLYAKWVPVPDSQQITMYVGGRALLNPKIPGGTWHYDKVFVSLTENSNGSVTIKALREGNTTIGYTYGYGNEEYAVAILNTELPKTGQDFLPVYLFIAASLALLVISLKIIKTDCG